MSRETMTIAEAAEILNSVGISDRDLSARLGKPCNFVCRIRRGDYLSYRGESVLPRLEQIIRDEAARLRSLSDSLLALLDGDPE